MEKNVEKIKVIIYFLTPLSLEHKKMSESERFAHMFEKSIGLVRKWSEIRVGLVAA